MQSQPDNSRTIFRIISWIVALMVACAVIFGSTFMVGPMFFGVPGLSDKITVMLNCPGAVSTSIDEGASTQTTTSPSGVYGHTVEITCKMADGSQKVIPNEQVALYSIGGMFGLGAVLGLCCAVPIMIVPFFLFRKPKNK